MMRQLSYDQLVLQIIVEMGCSDILTAESQFVGEGEEHIVAKFHLMCRPNKARVGVRSPRTPSIREKT